MTTYAGPWILALSGRAESPAVTEESTLMVARITRTESLGSGLMALYLMEHVFCINATTVLVAILSIYFLVARVITLETCAKRVVTQAKLKRIALMVMNLRQIIRG